METWSSLLLLNHPKGNILTRKLLHTVNVSNLNCVLNFCPSSAYNIFFFLLTPIHSPLPSVKEKYDYHSLSVSLFCTSAPHPFSEGDIWSTEKLEMIWTILNTYCYGMCGGPWVAQVSHLPAFQRMWSRAEIGRWWWWWCHGNWCEGNGIPPPGNMCAP